MSVSPKTVSTRLLGAYLVVRTAVTAFQFIAALHFFDVGTLLNALNSVILSISLAFLYRSLPSPAVVHSIHGSNPSHAGIRVFDSSRSSLLLTFAVSSTLLFVSSFHVMESLHSISSSADHEHHAEGVLTYAQAFFDIFVMYKLHPFRDLSCVGSLVPFEGILGPLSIPQDPATTPVLHAVFALALASLLPAATLVLPLFPMIHPGVAAWMLRFVLTAALWHVLWPSVTAQATVLLQGAPATAPHTHEAVRVWSADGVVMLSEEPAWAYMEDSKIESRFVYEEE